MNIYLCSADLKDKAKDKLTGHFGFLIGISFIIGFINFFASFILSLIVPVTSNTSYIISQCIQFILVTFIGVFDVGVTLVYLKYASGNNNVSLTDIFYGFSHNIQRSLFISLVFNAVSLILSLSYSIPYRIYLMTGDQTYLYIMFPILAVALLIYVPLSLTLSQCYFLMMDFPGKSATEIISLSAKVMKGHYLHLFYIEVSFIPLVLLGIVSVIGMLWINPYMKMTYTNFFFDIMKTEQKN